MQKKYKLITLALSSFLLLGCQPSGNENHTHKYSDIWSRDSEEHYHSCTVQGCNSKSDNEPHSFGDDGKCTVCGFYDKTKVKNSDEDPSVIAYAATSEGHYRVDSKGNKISELEEHVLVDSEGDATHVPAAATCTRAGKSYKQCSVCERMVEETIPALNHDFVVDQSRSDLATCTTKGRTFSKCSRCEETKVEETSALGHDWDEWNIIQQASTTEKGSKSRRCKRCELVETVEIEKLPDIHFHTFGTAWNHDGNMHWHDATCGHNVRGSEEPHSYGDWTTVVAPTETENGSKRKTCEICGYYVEETIPATGVVSNAFSFNSDITTAQKIHTTDQENFLKYNKEYYNITSSELNSYNAIGTSEHSFPNQVSLTWNYTVPSGKTIKNYSIITGQEADLSDGYTIVGTSAKSISFYNPFLGTNYFKVVANFTDNTSEVSPIKTFLVDATAPRNVKIDNMSNCRDMGGRTNVSGGKIRQGLIYRTAETGSNPSNAIKEEMINRFKLKSEIYVKDGGGSSSPLGSSVQFFNCSMDYGATPYSNMCRNAERLRKVFSVLGDVNNYPLFYHCRIGTDRTGICGVAINGVLGVPFNEVIQDYAFSNFGQIDGQRYAHKSSDPNGDDCAKYIDEILAMPGKNFQEQTIYYLLTIGVPAKTIQNVINIMTVGNKVTVPTDIVVANGDTLGVKGGSKKTSTDYTNPDTYYEIKGASQNVNFRYDMDESKEVTVVAYLGSTDSSSSKKLAGGIDLKIDGVSQTISNTKTYYLAGFGRTQQASRTGYMFNILGKFNLTSGSHNITVAGKNSDKFNIGSIAIIGASGTAYEGESGEGENGGNGGEQTHTHAFGTETNMPAANGAMAYGASTCSCGAKRISMVATDGSFASGSSNKNGTPNGWLKLNSNNNSISYNFNVPTTKVTIGVEACMDSWSGSGNKVKTIYSGTSNNSSPNIEFSVGSNKLDLSKWQDVEYQEIFPDDNPVASNHSGSAIVELGEIATTSGLNTLTIKRLASYNLIIRNVYIIYNA
ncbi:MAG: tyrosine-protein phosphatase [Bacilli bacterium]|nr:tyrosine-protein phosphatase [Bacilli bacterium]